MTPSSHAEPRQTRWAGWVWIVPVVALGIGGWLAFRELVHQGPEITIVFPAAHGVTAGETKIFYQGLSVGTVQGLALSDDRTEVVATAQMESSVEDLLRDGAVFWIGGNEVGLASLGSLKTLFSGAYIQMMAGSRDAPPVRRFQGLAQAPAVPPGSVGTRYVLDAAELGSLRAGSPVAYRGMNVGAVEETDMRDDGSGFRVHVFVHRPYDRFVRRDSRFWRTGEVRLSLGGAGIEAELPSPSELMSGGVAFGPASGLPDSPAAEPGRRFDLYEDHAGAMAAPTRDSVRYVVNLDADVGGLKPGSPVTLKGFVVGRVVEARLEFEAGSGAVRTPTTIELDPIRLGLSLGDGGRSPEVTETLRRLVARGLRARLEREPPFVGSPRIALAFEPVAEPASVSTAGELPTIPASAAGGMQSVMDAAGEVLADVRRMDLPAIARDLRDTVDRASALLSSAELERSVANLDKALADLAAVAETARTEVTPAMEEFRRAAAAAASAAGSAEGVLADRPGSGGGNVPVALEELTEAARAIRLLAQYLERHPEALLRGREGP